MESIWQAPHKPGASEAGGNGRQKRPPPSTHPHLSPPSNTGGRADKPLCEHPCSVSIPAPDTGLRSLQRPLLYPSIAQVLGLSGLNRERALGLRVPLCTPFFLFQMCSDARAVLQVANKVLGRGLRQFLNFIPWLSHRVVSGVSSVVFSRVGFGAVQGGRTWRNRVEPRSRSISESRGSPPPQLHTLNLLVHFLEPIEQKR